MFIKKILNYKTITITKYSPHIDNIQDTMYELMPIQIMHMMNVNGYTLRLVRQSGTVTDNMNATGKENTHHILGNTPVGIFHMGETASLRFNIIFNTDTI